MSHCIRPPKTQMEVCQINCLEKYSSKLHESLKHIYLIISITASKINNIDYEKKKNIGIKFFLIILIN